METKQQIEKREELFNIYTNNKFISFADLVIENITFDNVNNIVYFKTNKKNKLMNLEINLFKEYLYLLNLDNKINYKEKNNNKYNNIQIINNEFEIKITKNKIDFLSLKNDNENILNKIDYLIYVLNNIKKEINDY